MSKDDTTPDSGAKEQSPKTAEKPAAKPAEAPKKTEAPKPAAAPKPSTPAAQSKIIAKECHIGKNKGPGCGYRTTKLSEQTCPSCKTPLVDVY